MQMQNTMNLIVSFLIRKGIYVQKKSLPISKIFAPIKKGKPKNVALTQLAYNFSLLQKRSKWINKGQFLYFSKESFVVGTRNNCLFRMT